MNCGIAGKRKKSDVKCDVVIEIVGSVSPAMHKYILKPALWVAIHKFKTFLTKRPYSMYENRIVCDYRDGKVTKSDLDRCSTCDMYSVANNGLSEISKEQLINRTGEEIVNDDIVRQNKRG